jgi:hypothetical protein
VSAGYFIALYGFFLVVLLLRFCALFITYFRAKRRAERDGQTHWLLDFLLVSPLVLDQPARTERVARGERLLSTRELLGAIVLLATVVLAMVFDW